MKIFLRILIVAIVALAVHVDFKRYSYKSSNESDVIVESHEDRFQSVSFPLRRSPSVGSYWMYNPDIKICGDSGAREFRVRQALGFWERLGYEFGSVEFQRECIGEPASGVITIALVTSDIQIGSHLAVTRTFSYTSTREILKSVIYVMPFNANRELLLEHEIGHALGWDHYSLSYHVMHPDYARIGHNTRGLRHHDYLSRSLELARSLRDNE